MERGSAGVLPTFRVASGSISVAQFGDKTGFGQQFQRPVLVEVDHERIAGFTGADEGHDTVATGIGVLHDAGVAIDGEGGGGRVHAQRLPTG